MSNKEAEITRLNNTISKHKEKIRLWQRSIEGAEKAIRHNEHRKSKLSGTDYYVYIVMVDGKPRYVGKGKGNRYRHALSGTSSCPELNKAFFDNKYIEVLFAQKNVSEEYALLWEDRWIGILHSALLDLGDNGLYNKKLPERLEYADERLEFIYHTFFEFVEDNSDNSDVSVVRPEKRRSVWDHTCICDCEDYHD